MALESTSEPEASIVPNPDTASVSVSASASSDLPPRPPPRQDSLPTHKPASSLNSSIRHSRTWTSTATTNTTQTPHQQAQAQSRRQSSVPAGPDDSSHRRSNTDGPGGDGFDFDPVIQDTRYSSSSSSSSSSSYYAQRHKSADSATNTPFFYEQHPQHRSPPSDARLAQPKDQEVPALPPIPPAPVPPSSSTTAVPPRFSSSSSVTSHIKRKPLSATASSIATAFQTTPTFVELPKPDTRFARPPSLDSPTLYDYDYHLEAPLVSHGAVEPQPAFQPLDPEPASTDNAPVPASNSRRNPPPTAEHFDLHHDESSSIELSDVLSVYDEVASESTPNASPAVSTAERRLTHESYTHDDKSKNSHHHATTAVDAADSANSTDPFLSTPMFAPKPTPPHLRLQKVDTSISNQDAEADIELDSPTLLDRSAPADPKLNKPLPKSPSGQTSPFNNLFSWGNNNTKTQKVNSPATTDISSLPSPSTPTRGGLVNDSPRLPNNAAFPHNPKSDAAVANPIGYCESYLSTPPPLASTTSIHLEEMEDELKAISSELAASIRREIDLEDLVDRLQDQANNPQAPSKRTSDYFSDSGYSSAKLSDYDQSREEIEKIQRRSEQEKASIRLELTNKIQDERSKIKALDQQVKELAERASRIDLAEMNNLDANGRVKELENTCEDLQRKLSEERLSKTNFEDLLTALKGELHDVCNERDNLRDEIVPQLRARVEGLESEAAGYASLTYESTKMQHQLQSLQKENSTLRNSTFGADDAMFRNQRAPVARSDSTAKNGQAESREALAERLKDVEAQRDALHNALKNLLERQEFQNRENNKKIKVLENERQRLLSDSPKKAGFEKDISTLRTEVNVLRRRAEEAMEQKWEVEKGLGGLKMDLDRAEEEVNALRTLLKEHDILVPGEDHKSADESASQSLGTAYKELQNQYNESLERIKKLESGLGGQDEEKTKQALERLERSLNAALSERDVARHDATGLQSQYDNLATSAAKNLDSERALADELTESATRVEQLASQVRSQLATNSELRQRLTDAVTRGDADRKSNSDRIAGLQERLRGLEDQLVSAQTSSEERVGRHEEELSKLKEAHNEQLRRLQNGGSVGMTGPRKTSLLNPANAIPKKTFEEEAEIKKLRQRVLELETALSDADKEMQEVINKMSTAQIEVMNLQEEREAAIRETKRLQGMLKQEQTSPFAGRLRALAVGA